MRTISAFVTVMALWLAGGCTSGQSYELPGYDFNKINKVAIVDVVGDVGSNMAKNQLSDMFAMELVKKGFTPVERSQVQSLLKEHEFQAGNLTPEEDAVRAGKILNVPAVAIINVSVRGEEMSMTAKIIEVETGAVVWIGSGSGSTGRTLATIAGAAAGAGAGAAIGGKDNRVFGGIVGGVLGGVAGRALSPQVAEKAQQIIKKMCKNLPYRTAAAR